MTMYDRAAFSVRLDVATNRGTNNGGRNFLFYMEGSSGIRPLCTEITATITAQAPASDISFGGLCDEEYVGNVSGQLEGIRARATQPCKPPVQFKASFCKPQRTGCQE